ncbi:hypothetical protein OSB04_031905 [Centaurea solstitialis]|uniref:Uncharacterized protein n=1 Tax=Centaurea solstitialis TaxID=347529 RepID=A0AA38STY9_9ASTR|nr:hypothetical protein OSB04_031905 [Centaurea solstitialis]
MSGLLPGVAYPVSDHLPFHDHQVFGAAAGERLVEPFVEPERELRKKNKKNSKAGKVRPRALNFEMGEETPMWNTRRPARTVPTQPITKPNLETEIKGQFLHMIKELTLMEKAIAILSFTSRASRKSVICSKVKTTGMPFAYGCSHSHLWEKLKLGFVLWSRVRLPLGRTYDLSSYPDSSHIKDRETSSRDPFVPTRR